MNRFIELGNDVGTYHSAGLPNITGTFLLWKTVGEESGAFVSAYCDRRANSKNGGSDNTYKVTMNASRANKIYGSSTTVQPASLVLLPIIKT